MLQLVKIALGKPYTFVVMAILIVLGGSIAWLRSPTDIFPDIKMPVIAAVWSYKGLPPKTWPGASFTITNASYRPPSTTSITSKASPMRHGRGQNLLSPRRRHSHRHRTGDRDFANRAETDAAGHDAAAGDEL
jgi:hypothetical protein